MLKFFNNGKAEINRLAQIADQTREVRDMVREAADYSERISSFIKTSKAAGKADFETMTIFLRELRLMTARYRMLLEKPKRTNPQIRRCYGLTIETVRRAIGQFEDDLMSISSIVSEIDPKKYEIIPIREVYPQLG